MKKLLAFICLCIQIVPIMGQSVLRTSHGVKVDSWASAGKTVVICYDATRKGEV